MEIEKTIIEVLIPLLQVYFLPIGYFGGLIIGNTFILTISVLSGKGTFPYVAVFLVAYAAALTSDNAWFYLSKRDSVSRFFRRKAEKIYGPIDTNKQSSVTSDYLLLQVTKFIYGTELLTVIYLGLKKTSYKRFFLINTPAAFIWIFSLTGVGWLAGKGFSGLVRIFNNVRIALTIFILILVLLFILWRLSGKVLIKKKVLTN